MFSVILDFLCIDCHCLQRWRRVHTRNSYQYEIIIFYRIFYRSALLFLFHLSLAHNTIIYLSFSIYSLLLCNVCLDTALRSDSLSTFLKITLVVNIVRGTRSLNTTSRFCFRTVVSSRHSPWTARTYGYPLS